MRKVIIFLAVIGVSMGARMAKAQIWNSEVQTSITSNNSGDRVASYADNAGTHLLVQSGSDINYVLLNATGNVARSTTLSTNGEYPNITAAGGNIYAVYLSGNDINVAQTTDEGADWNTSAIPPLTINSTNCSGVAAVADYYNTARGVWTLPRFVDKEKSQ